MGNAIKCVKSCLEKMKLQPPPSDKEVRAGGRAAGQLSSERGGKLQHTPALLHSQASRHDTPNRRSPLACALIHTHARSTPPHARARAAGQGGADRAVPGVFGAEGPLCGAHAGQARDRQDPGACNQGGVARVLVASALAAGALSWVCRRMLVDAAPQPPRNRVPAARPLPTQDGDTVMTYAYSSVVAATLLAAHKVGRGAGPGPGRCAAAGGGRQRARSPLRTPRRCSPSTHRSAQAGKRFDVVVVDSRPLLEGRRMLSALLEGGITCEYCHLSALSYQITEVDKARPCGWLGGRAGTSAGGVGSDACAPARPRRLPLWLRLAHEPSPPPRLPLPCRSSWAPPRC